MKNFVDSLDVVLQIIKSLIKLIVLKAAVYNYFNDTAGVSYALYRVPSL